MTSPLFVYSVKTEKRFKMQFLPFTTNTALRPSAMQTYILNIKFSCIRKLQNSSTARHV